MKTFLKIKTKRQERQTRTYYTDWRSCEGDSGGRDG